MSWKTAHRSFYYATAEEPGDIVLPCMETAHLSIDIQNTYLQKDDPAEAERWTPFFDRMRGTVIPQYRKADRRMPRARRGEYLRPHRLFETGRARSLAQPEETGVQLSTHAQGQRREARSCPS